jgi:hypothetical protein
MGQHWIVLGASLFAIGMGLMYAVASLFIPTMASSALPAAGVFTFAGMIGGAASQALREMEKRLRVLEDKIAESRSTQS